LYIILVNYTRDRLSRLFIYQ